VIVRTALITATFFSPKLVKTTLNSVFSSAATPASAATATGAVATAAQTLGNRTLDPEHLREVVQGRFADALGEVAAKMTLDEIQENRGQFVKEVTRIANESIGHTGLALETVSIISLDQTPIEQFNPANTFDSQGLTQLTEQIESRKKKRNDITQDTKFQLKTRI